MTNLEHPGRYVRERIIPKGMSVTKAARTIGVGRPALSNFLNGNAALSPEMAVRLQKAFSADPDDLMNRQAMYDSSRWSGVRATVANTRTYVPPFLMVKANDVEAWAEEIDSRSRLSVLLRNLVHSTCDGLNYVDFPGNDDAQRPGWDGMVETTEGNPWVPIGTSAWEFGTDRAITQKATRDYEKRTAATKDTEREKTTFVFVTPRRWNGKTDWVTEKRAEGKWRGVVAWDSSDIEQWLEQSIPAQAWFGSLRGFDMGGVKSLDKCWVEWCADCEPTFTGHIFDEAMGAFGSTVCSHLRNAEDGLLRIVADSREEGLAFLYIVLSQHEDLRGFIDRMVVFTKRNRLPKLAVGSPGFIPVIADAEIEKELAQSGCKLKGFVIEWRTAVQHEAAVTLEPLSREAFRQSLESMGLDRDEIKRRDRESGRSLTVLRRRLSRNEGVRAPSWGSDQELAEAIAPMMLAGAWNTNNDSDRYLMHELAGVDDKQLDTHFTRLLHLEDSPVWSAGGLHGVVSKIDALYAVHGWINPRLIERFMEVAGVVLSEQDPSLDLPEEDRPMASIFGKSREISSPFRKGLAESLVLLAIHGRRLFGKRTGLDPERMAAEMVRELLEPMTANNLLSQASNLPLYAEAAPDDFLSILELDLDSEQPAAAALMEPVADTMFGRHDRVHLLTALDILGWSTEWLPRVVKIHGKLAELEPHDNIVDKPSESLLSLLGWWMPQTSASLEQRTAAFDLLAEQHPGIGWQVATSQFSGRSRVFFHNQKPVWRGYALGWYGAQRPIILFGGLNGAGKTTLLMAIKLALYGRHALGMGTSKASYSKFIRGCIYSSSAALVQPNSAYVELDFVYGKLGRQSRYVVRRSWYQTGREIREALALSEDGVPQSSLSQEACQGFLNELVPIGVSELFFFDGEKIAELAEDHSGSALGGAIHRLLGLDLVERLRSDLRVYMLHREKRAADKDVVSEIETLQRIYEDLKAELTRHGAELHRAQEELDVLVADRDRLEVRLTERGGDWGASREAQRERAKELAEALRREERELREELAGSYPLSLASDVLADCLEVAATSLMSLTRRDVNELLREFAASLKEELDGSGRTAVDDLLVKSLQPVDDSLPLFDISHRALGRMDHTVRHGIPEAHARIDRITRHLGELKEELETVTLRIEQAPDEAALAVEFEKLATLNERINEAGADIAVRRREIKSGYAHAINIARKLRDRHKALSERQESERPLEYADGARHLLRDFRRVNAERKIAQLEEEFAVAFRRLARKEDIVTRASIDPHRFTVKLLNRDGGEIQKTQLSAGEKQIYAIAMLEALAQTSGRRLPVVIDTPLGRLDSHHRANLVSNYFPRASHQVVLLSTDTEVDESFYRQLSPQISHAFEIRYDEQKHAAELDEGYFWRTRMRKAS